MLLLVFLIVNSKLFSEMGTVKHYWKQQFVVMCAIFCFDMKENAKISINVILKMINCKLHL